MKIFAFLFKDNYSMSELFSGTREVGYYGESQSFSIGTQTNNLSLGITLIQVPGTGTDTEGGTDTLLDTIAPTASVTTATITTSGNAVVQSTETGTAYLVNTTVSVSNNFTSITGAADSQWNSVAITLVNTDTNLPATGLADGTYKVYAVDAAGNLSSASSNSVTVATTVTDTTAPTVTFNPANGDTGEAISDNITITFSEAVRNIDNTVLTDSNIDSLITLKLDNASGNNINFDATINGDKTVITINPTSNLPNSQAVYVALGATVEDSTDNVITAVNATFTTVMGGYYIAGDGSGGGGAGDYGYEYNKLALGGHGAGDNDTIVGTSYNDVIFGDGSGGGGGGSKHRLAAGGNSGSGSDNIDGGAGNDIIFGDGFKGNDNHGTTNWEHGGIGGFGGGGGGGGSYSPNGNGGNGGLLAGGGGGQSDKVFGISLYGGVSGGINSKPAGGVAHISDNKWGGNSAMPSIVGAGYFNEQSKGGTGSNAFGAGGGAGFGGLNSINQVITTSTSPWTYQYCSGGLPQGGNGGTGSTNKVIYDDSSGNLYSYVSGQLTSIFGSTPGTLNGVGTGADIIDGGAGNDHLFGLGGNDIFVFEITDAGASDVDVIWDFNRLGEGDKIRLTNNNNIISNTDINSIIASQVANGNNRTIIFNDGGGKQVSIEVKNIGRNLVVADFDS
jgi:methionine-rich copper-binding protein CopC